MTLCLGKQGPTLRAGPFTLAGQVTDMDGLYLMLMKKPQQALALFERLTQLILRLIDVYHRAGVDFMQYPG